MVKLTCNNKSLRKFMELPTKEVTGCAHCPGRLGGKRTVCKMPSGNLRY